MIIDITQTKVEHELQERVNLGFLYYVPVTLYKPESFSHIVHNIDLLHNNGFEVARFYLRQYNDSNWFAPSVCKNQLTKPKWFIEKTLPKNEALLECIVPKRSCPKLYPVSSDIVSECVCWDDGIRRYSGVIFNWDLKRLEVDMNYLECKRWRDLKRRRISRK